MGIETATDARATKDNTRFFVRMAAIMTVLVVAGFVFQLSMGRSSFDVPWQYHVHGVLFMGWLGFYLLQHLTAHRGNFVLHSKLGKMAYLFIPAMVAVGLLIMVTVARRNGGPFFFNVSEFLH